MTMSNDLWYIGVLLEILSTMSGTAGKQLIRLAELRKRSNPKASTLAFHLGLIVNTVVGPILDMAAYSFAPQSLIAPFGGLDVVWNAALAPYFLRESLTRRRAIGCVLIVMGTATAGGFGNHTDPEYTIEYLEETIVSFRVLIYFVIFMCWFFLNNFVLVRAPAGSAVRGVSLGCTAGTLAGNMFCVKAAIELIQRSIHELDGEIWQHWLPYVMILGAVFFALSNVVYMTKGLTEYEALFMVTIYEGSMIVSGCISGAVVLLDMKGLQAWRVAVYFLGVSVIVLGMYVIFSQEARSTSSLIAGEASIELPKNDGRGSVDSSPGRARRGNMRVHLENFVQKSSYARNSIEHPVCRSKSVDNIHRACSSKDVERRLARSSSEPCASPSFNGCFSDPLPSCKGAEEGIEDLTCETPTGTHQICMSI